MEQEEEETRRFWGLNESPSKKEGKYARRRSLPRECSASMKALPKRKGNTKTGEDPQGCQSASMKALPKRKGNLG